MKLLMHLMFMFIVYQTYLACSQVNFSVDEERCKGSQNCVVQQGFLRFEDTQFIGGGKVDILIVNDNSASMSFEQRKLAERFHLFIEKLEQRYVDYRLAITTTDISDQVDQGTAGNSPREVNQQGLLQDGNLVVFDNGQSYLSHVDWNLSEAERTTSIGEQAHLFAQSLTRAETLKCEQFVADYIKAKGLGATGSPTYGAEYAKNCPSGDERGIYAASLVLEKNPNAFIRPDAHLVVIFLSDEEVRSGKGFDSIDSSTSFLENFQNHYGTSQKDLKAHAVVVKNDTCLAKQNDQTLGDPPVSQTRGFVKGSWGREYLKLAAATNGIEGDICALDYTGQLSEIEGKTQNLPIILKCDRAQDVQVHVLNEQGEISRNADFEVVGTEIHLKETLQAGTRLSYSHTCDPALVR